MSTRKAFHPKIHLLMDRKHEFRGKIYQYVTYTLLPRMQHQAIRQWRQICHAPDIRTVRTDYGKIGTKGDG